MTRKSTPESATKREAHGHVPQCFLCLPKAVNAVDLSLKSDRITTAIEMISEFGKIKN